MDYTSIKNHNPEKSKTLTGTMQALPEPHTLVPLQHYAGKVCLLRPHWRPNWQPARPRALSTAAAPPRRPPVVVQTCASSSVLWRLALAPGFSLASALRLAPRPVPPSMSTDPCYCGPSAGRRVACRWEVPPVSQGPRGWWERQGWQGQAGIRSDRRRDCRHYSEWKSDRKSAKKGTSQARQYTVQAKWSHGAHRTTVAGKSPDSMPRMGCGCVQVKLHVRASGTATRARASAQSHPPTLPEVSPLLRTLSRTSPALGQASGSPCTHHSL